MGHRDNSSYSGQQSGPVPCYCPASNLVLFSCVAPMSHSHGASQVALAVKSCHCRRYKRHGLIPELRRSLEEMAATQYLPGKFHRQRRVGYSQRVTESNTTEHMTAPIHDSAPISNPQAHFSSLLLPTWVTPISKCLWSPTQPGCFCFLIIYFCPPGNTPPPEAAKFYGNTHLSGIQCLSWTSLSSSLSSTLC